MDTTFYTELISRDSNGRVRVVYATGEWDRNACEFTINKRTGLLGGKLTDQPEKIITEGKAKRTPLEQGILEYKSQLKKYLDKGYKDVKELFNKKKLRDISIDEINQVLPLVKTDSNGIPKPMLAKSSKDVATKAFDKEYYGSRKIDGVRALLYREDLDNGEWIVRSASRGGQNYDSAIRHILFDPSIRKIFELYPKVILDGELYVHGWSLQRISGTARLEKITNPADLERTESLQYWIYDIADDKKIFMDRLEILWELEPIINESKNLKFVEHIPISGWLNIKKKHDAYVNEGFEGIVIRRLDAVYGYGKRTASMIKVKEYQDAEFLIVGWEPGLRPVEDMCFVMETKYGRRFRAKPMGDRLAKQEYVDNMDKIIGKMGTVSFFYLSDDGTPLQPVFKHLRPEDE